MAKKEIIGFLIVGAALWAPPGEIRAQEFAGQISRFIGANARQFLQPVADGFMTDANAGMSVVPSGAGFHIGLQFVVVGALMRDEQRTFLSTPFNETVEFQYNGAPFLGDLEVPAMELPTAVGMSKSVTVGGRLKRIRPKGLPYVPGPYDLITQDATATFGGSSDITMVPLFAPQLTAGSLAGTELTIRYLPTVTLGDAGNVGVFGVGVRHDVGRYIASPVNVALLVSHQSLSMSGTASGTDFRLDASSFAIQLQSGILFGTGIIKAGPYTLIGLESASADIGYAFADPNLGKQELTFESGTQSRFAIGAQLKIAFVTINGEYNLGMVNGFVASAGVAFEFN